MTGTVLTNKGLALIAKAVSAQTMLNFSRVAVGIGSTPPGYDPQSMIELNGYKMDAAITSYGVSPERADTAYLVAQISSIDVQSGFAITEAGVFATDPDEGEILYAYLDLTEDPQYIYASTDAISKFAEITFNVIIGSVTSVTAIVSPGAMATKKEHDRLEKRVSAIEAPEFDDLGDIGKIGSFPDLLSVMVSGMDLFQFLSDLKAGLQFVLHKDQLVNDCDTDDAERPLAAAQGKLLMDGYDQMGHMLSDIQGAVNTLDARMTLMELMYRTEVSGNPFVITFDSLEGVDVEGVWDQSQKRIYF